MLIKKATGKKIKELILEKGSKITDISSYMGFQEPRALYKWINGNTLPSVENLLRLSKLLETPMDEIIKAEEMKDERKSSSFDVIKKLLLLLKPEYRQEKSYLIR